MFRFPFGTTQELNLDWFLEQWEVFKQEAQTALDGIDHALDDEIQRVEDAMTDLYAARDAAVAAKNNALDYAQSANTSAIGASQSAQNSAASAVTSATQAQSAAQSATSAQSSATNAGTSAGNALTQAQQSEAWATGEIGGVHVPPSAPQNQSNSKQYATNAQLSANAANTAKNDARVYSQDSKAWATGVRDGQPVTSEDETYQNNAKYYAESISGDAAAAAQSASAAAASESAAAASAASVAQSEAQITQNATDIDELQNAMDSLVIPEESKNLLDPNTYTSGYMSSIAGNITASDDWRTTDFLPIDDADPIYVSMTYPAFRYIFYTDPNKESHVGDYGNVTTNKATLTPPTGANYIRVSYVVLNDNRDYSQQYISTNDYYEPYNETFYVASENLIKIIKDTSPFYNIKIVSKDGRGDYTSISAAVTAALDGDIIYVLPGEYEDSVICSTKDLSIIGFSKADCILWNDTGDYDTPPLQMSHGYLKNMTLKAVQKPEDQGKTSNIPYCVHADLSFPADHTKRRLEIDNCDMYSDWSDCIGAGTTDDGIMIIRNCYLETTDKSFRYPFAYHNTTSPSNALLVLENNRMVNNGSGSYCVYLYDYDYESLTTVEMICNTAKSVVSGVTDSNFVLNANNHGKFILANTSHANNIASMNYSN